MRRRYARAVDACRRLREQCEELRRENKRLREDTRRLTKELEIATAILATTNDRPTEPHDPLGERPLPRHQFCVRLIALAIEMAKRIGFRATADVLQTVFATLGITHKVPSHDAIEQWTLRLGVGELKDTFNKDQRVIWMADHSSQIGKEKVLLIIGIAIEDLRPPGQTLSLEHMKVLAIVPGTQWKKQDVQREYQRLAAQIGAPVYLLCDGATELREPAEKLRRDGKPTIVLGDLKHHAANLLEKQIGRSPAFISFMTLVGLTRNRVQQTELSHFAPPPLKQKSRFMNLAALLHWSEMTLYHLDHPDSEARQGISPERMEEKLGWLRKYASDIAQWSDCQRVIDQALSLINHDGLDQGTSDELTKLLAPWCTDRQSAEPATQLALDLLKWVKAASDSLHPGDRAWLSTEVLESLFGRFKRLERQHSRGGFTRLLAALPTLCRRVTGSLVRLRFNQVQSGDVTSWIETKVGRTLAACRNLAYREFSKKTCVHA